MKPDVEKPLSLTQMLETVYTHNTTGTAPTSVHENIDAILKLTTAM